jgi:hypothetical protein
LSPSITRRFDAATDSMIGGKQVRLLDRVEPSQ